MNSNVIRFGAVLFLGVTLIGCDVFDDDDDDDDSEAAAFWLQSDSFDAGEGMPTDYTCEAKGFGEGINPELHWANAPEGTQSFAIVFKDLTLVNGDPQFADRGYHSLIWDIPADATSVPEGLPAGSPESGELAGAQQLGAFGEVYMGPCPSWATACPNGPPRVEDTYAFEIYALDVEEAELPEVGEDESAVRVYDDYFADIAIDSTRIQATSDAQPAELPETFLDGPCAAFAE